MSEGICPRCGRRMGALWMGSTGTSMHDNQTTICDVCVSAEMFEAGIAINALATNMVRNGFEPRFDPTEYKGEPYWKE